MLKLALAVGATGDRDNVLDDLLGVLGLASTTLTAVCCIARRAGE